MGRKFILHKTGTQYIETEIPDGREASTSTALPYDAWETLEKRLADLGAYPEAIRRVKSDFESGKTSTSIEVEEPEILNELFLAVLPLIHISNTAYFGFGLTEQTLTLFPDRRFATVFFPDEVDGYIVTFKSRADRYLGGGHVIGYDIIKEPTEDGRVVVKVVQRVK